MNTLVCSRSTWDHLSELRATGAGIAAASIAAKRMRDGWRFVVAGAAVPGIERADTFEETAQRLQRAHLGLLTIGRHPLETFQGLLQGRLDLENPRDCGSIVMPHGEQIQLDRVVLIGDTIDFLGVKGTVMEYERFDRSIRAIGAEGQAVLSTLRIGVIGLGGTGSAIAQLCALNGIDDYDLYDARDVKDSSLNRLYGGYPDAVGRPKVEIAREMINTIRPAATVRTTPRSVLVREVGETLLDCDLVFCCTDEHASRALVNQLAYQYLLPVIDFGVQIDVVDDKVDRITGRVQYLAPGRPCLLCTGVIDPEEVRREYLTEAQRELDPYVRGARVQQPAVASLNGTVAGLAFSMLMSITTGLPGAERLLLYRGIQQTVRAVDAVAAPGCLICARSLGRGDHGLIDLWSAA